MVVCTLDSGDGVEISFCDSSRALQDKAGRNYGHNEENMVLPVFLHTLHTIYPQRVDVQWFLSYLGYCPRLHFAVYQPDFHCPIHSQHLLGNLTRHSPPAHCPSWGDAVSLSSASDD